MDENKNHISNRLGEQLPSHSPDPGTWQRLSSKLDATDAEAVYQEKLQGLPIHSPDQGTWSIISGRLNRIAYYKTSVRIALSVAAGLLLLITVTKISDNYQTRTNKNVPQFSKQGQITNPSGTSNKSNPDIILKEIIQQTGKPAGNAISGNEVVAYVAGSQVSIQAEADSKMIPSGNKTADITTVNLEPLTTQTKSAAAILNNANVVLPATAGNEVAVQSDNNTGQVTQNTSIHVGVPPIQEITSTTVEPKSILFQKEQYATTASTSTKQYPPGKPVSLNNKNHVALDMNYLPENVYNGTENSLFHNVDLTASYNKQKVRFNTSVGMAYNEEQLSFDMFYDINTPVTAMGPGGKVDTMSYNVANMESEYMGTEKHKYITYNLGFGRRIFSSGKFSTWFNAGAGFGVQLNNPDLIASTTNSIKNQYNARVVSVRSSKPVYNDVNVNFVTAIDFNYKILNKLSITVTPTSRWYFKPVLTLNNQATDELTLGFRTGLKFDF